MASLLATLALYSTLGTVAEKRKRKEEEEEEKQRRGEKRKRKHRKPRQSYNANTPGKIKLFDTFDTLLIN